MKKFSKEQAEIIIKIALEERRRNKELHVGQSVWNTARDANPELMGKMTATSSDFFYFRNGADSIDMFYKDFVE